MHVGDTGEKNNNEADAYGMLFTGGGGCFVGGRLCSGRRLGSERLRGFRVFGTKRFESRFCL